MNLIPSVTLDEMRAVERTMADDMGVSPAVMIEHAARNTLDLCRSVFEGNMREKKIAVLAGKGRNGAVGLAVARHVANAGALPVVFLSSVADDLGEHARAQCTMLMQSGIPVHAHGVWKSGELASKLKSADLIIDALLGYNLVEDPREPMAGMIASANNAQKPILALDAPSGLHVATGKPSASTIQAEWTLVFALPKAGLLKPDVKRYTGDMFLADIAVPPAVYAKLNLDVPLFFEKESIVRLV